MFISPQLSHAVLPSLVLTSVLDVPIYQYYRGSQMGTTIGFSTGLIRRFGLGTPETENPPPQFRSRQQPFDSTRETTRRRVRRSQS